MALSYITLCTTVHAEGNCPDSLTVLFFILFLLPDLWSLALLVFWYLPLTSQFLAKCWDFYFWLLNPVFLWTPLTVSSTAPIWSSYLHFHPTSSTNVQCPWGFQQHRPLGPKTGMGWTSLKLIINLNRKGHSWEGMLWLLRLEKF